MVPGPKIPPLSLSLPAQLGALASQVVPAIASQAPAIAGAAKIGARANLLQIAAAPARPGGPAAGLLVPASAAIARRTIEAASSGALSTFAAKFAEMGRRNAQSAATTAASGLIERGQTTGGQGEHRVPGALITPKAAPQRAPDGTDPSQGADSSRSKASPAKATGTNDFAGLSRDEARLLLSQKLPPAERQALKADIHRFYNHGTDAARESLQAQWGERLGVADFDDNTIKLLLFAATDVKPHEQQPQAAPAAAAVPAAPATSVPAARAAQRSEASAASASASASAADAAEAAAAANPKATTEQSKARPQRPGGPADPTDHGASRPAGHGAEPTAANQPPASTVAGSPDLEEPVQNAASSFEKQMEMINKQQERMQIVSAKMELEAAGRSMVLQALRDMIKDQKEAVKDAGEAGHKA